MMTLMLSSFPYPFAAFILSAIVGVAAIVLRDHLRDSRKKATHPGRPFQPPFSFWKRLYDKSRKHQGKPEGDTSQRSCLPLVFVMQLFGGSMLGLKREAVKLCEHQKEWEVEAQNTIARLKAILGDVAKDIQHVGSTSVLSIKAKPIIDIAVAVDDFAAKVI